MREGSPADSRPAASWEAGRRVHPAGRKKRSYEEYEESPAVPEILHILHILHTSLPADQRAAEDESPPPPPPGLGGKGSTPNQALEDEVNARGRGDVLREGERASGLRRHQRCASSGAAGRATGHPSHPRIAVPAEGRRERRHRWGSGLAGAWGTSPTDRVGAVTWVHASTNRWQGGKNGSPCHGRRRIAWHGAPPGTRGISGPGRTAHRASGPLAPHPCQHPSPGRRFLSLSPRRVHAPRPCRRARLRVSRYGKLRARQGGRGCSGR